VTPDGSPEVEITMLPSMAARFMSFADVEYRRQELTEEFARVRRGRNRRAQRRADRRAAHAAAAPVQAQVVTPRRQDRPAQPAQPVPSGRPSRPATTDIPTQADARRPAAAGAGQRRPAA
jgi:hypothetical protein